MKSRTSPPGAARLPIFGLGRVLVRLEEDKDKPGGGGGNPPPNPNPPPPQPFAVFDSSDAFNKRMEREARRILKEQGIEDPAAVKQMLDDYAKIKAAQEEERKKQMTEVDRMREERNQFETSSKEAMSRAEEAELKAHLFQVFAEKGIRNFDYAFYKVSSKLAGLGETEELDERAYLDELLANETEKAALGLAAPAAPAQPVQRQGVTTTDPAKGPTAPPAGGNPPPPADAFSMKKDDFNADLQKRFGFTPMTG